MALKKKTKLASGVEADYFRIDGYTMNKMHADMAAIYEAKASKAPMSQAQTDKSVNDLKKWAAARGGAPLKDPKTGKLFGK